MTLLVMVMLGATVAAEQPVPSAHATRAAVDDTWPADPNRTRYFLAPSAMMLRGGEVSLSQKELVVTSVSVGLTDWLSLQAGSVLPAPLFLEKSANFLGGAKVGVSVTDRVHLAAGVQGLSLPFALQGLGFAYAAGTYGGPDAHVTLAAGVPFDFVPGVHAAAGEVLFTVSGNLRVGRHVALMTENWVLPMDSAQNILMANAVGVRLFGKHLAVDLAAVVFSSSLSGVFPAPIPWVDFTWNF